MKARPPKSFRDLWVWQQGIELTLRIHHLTQPISSQHDAFVIPLIRTVSRIPVKVARGVGIGRGAYVRGLLTAYGATQEVETQLHLLGELNLVAADQLARVRLQNDEISQTLVNMLMSMPMAPEFDL